MANSKGAVMLLEPRVQRAVDKDLMREDCNLTALSKKLRKELGIAAAPGRMALSRRRELLRREERSERLVAEERAKVTAARAVLDEAPEARVLKIDSAEKVKLRAERLIERAERFMDVAEGEGDIRTAIAALREAREGLVLFAKHFKVIDDSPVTVNVQSAQLAVLAAFSPDELRHMLRALAVEGQALPT